MNTQDSTTEEWAQEDARIQEDTLLKNPSVTEQVEALSAPETATENVNVSDAKEVKTLKQILLVSLLNFLKGILVGVVNIVPGFSSGTVLILCKLYEPVLDSASGLTKSKKQFKQGVIFLAPIAVGALVGILAFAQAISFMLSRFSLPSFALFAGLIAGGIPMMVAMVYANKKERLDLVSGECCVSQKESNTQADGAQADSVDIGGMQNDCTQINSAQVSTAQAEGIQIDCVQVANMLTDYTQANGGQATNTQTAAASQKLNSFKAWQLIPMVLACAFVIVLAWVQRILPVASDSYNDTLTFFNAFMLVLGGILSAASLIIPGLSGALMLILLGQYQMLLDAISLSSPNVVVILIFGASVVVGLLLAIKLVRFLLRRFRTIVHLCIIGFLAGGAVGLFMLEETFYSATNGAGITIAVVLTLGGIATSFFLGRIGERKK